MVSNEIIGRLIGNKNGAGFFPEREAIELCADLNGEIELVRKSSLDTALARIKELDRQNEEILARNVSLDAAMAEMELENDVLKAKLAEAESRLRIYSDDDVLHEIRALVRLHGSQQEFAKERKVSESYVSDVLNKRRAIPEQWAVAAGFSRPRWQRDTPKTFSKIVAAIDAEGGQ